MNETINNLFIIYIPGCFSTSLLKGNDVVWPLNNQDMVKLYLDKIIAKPFRKIFSKKVPENDMSNIVIESIKKIADKNLIPGPLTPNNNNMLELIKKLVGSNYYIFNYDWRQSFENNIEDLALKVDKLDITNKDITIISHSAGGIIGYKYGCEVEKYNTSEYSNFSKITNHITIGCPIEGCLKALVSLLGLYHQSILTSQEVKAILTNGFFDSIYELLPSRIYNLFYYSDTKEIVKQETMIDILYNYGFDEEKLKKFATFRNDMQQLTPNNKINNLFIIGAYDKKSMCVGFKVDRETHEIECEYNYGAGDGTVLYQEAFPTHLSHRVKTVIGKHAYLTECDEVLDIIEEELTSQKKPKMILDAKILSHVNKELEFQLFLLKGNKKYLIKDIKAEQILFTQKTNSQNLTKTLIHNKKKNSFNFKTSLQYGILKFRNVIFDYVEDMENVVTEEPKVNKNDISKLLNLTETNKKDENKKEENKKEENKKKENKKEENKKDIEIIRETFKKIYVELETHDFNTFF